MKRTTLFGSIALIVSMILSGCSAAQPEDTVNEYFAAIQNLDFESMALLIAPSNSDDIEESTNIFDDQDNEFPEFLFDYLKSKASKIEYLIVDSTVDGDRASVTVDCEYVDSGPIIQATLGEVFSRSMELAFTGVEITEEESNEIFAEVMEEQIELLDETYKSVTLSIELINIEGTWYIADISEEMLDVVMSGFLSAVTEMMDSIFEVTE